LALGGAALNLRVRTWKHIGAYGSVAALMSILVPSTFLFIFLPPLPLFVQVPIYATLISVPLTFLGLYMFKRVNEAIDMLDAHVKLDHLTGLMSRVSRVCLPRQRSPTP
jgi:hypothetical protein